MILRALASLVVLGLLLSMAINTMAASETTGLLATGTTTEWTVNGEHGPHDDAHLWPL